MISRLNLFQLRQILAKRFGVTIDAIAKSEVWQHVYFIVIKGRKPRFVSKSGFFRVPHGYGLTKRSNVNIVSDPYFIVRYMAENDTVGYVEYVHKEFLTTSKYHFNGNVKKTFKRIEDAIAFIVDEHAAYLKKSIMGF